LTKQKTRTQNSILIILFLIMKNALMGLALFAAMPVFAQQKATINVHPEQGKEIISKHIYWTICRASGNLYLWRFVGR